MNIRKSFAGLAILSSIALLTSACGATASSQEYVPTVRTVTVTSTQAGNVFSGKVTADMEIQTVSKLSGKITKVYVEEGQSVKKGDILAELESDDYVQQVKQAESGLISAKARLADMKAGARNQEIRSLQSAVDLAKASLDTAQQNYDRMKELYDSGAVALVDLENAALNLDKATTGYQQASAQLSLAKEGATANSIEALQAEVNRLEASLALAESSLDNTKITAPIDGIIAARSIDAGEMAQPGVPLFTIVKMDQVNILTSIPEDKINSVQTGSTLDVKIASLNGQVFQGTVDFVSPVSDPNNNTFPIKVKVNNSDGLLKAGMGADVYLSGQSAAYQIPSSSVMNEDSKTFVYTIAEGNTVKKTEVVLGQTGEDRAEVVSGLEENANVVINPSDTLQDGTQVIVE